MSKNWLREHRQDSYYRKAKQEGYRSRAAFKLYQINQKFRLMRKGNMVIDLGAAPGGWSQVALEIVGDEGMVVGIDIDSIRPMPGAEFIRGDMLAIDAMDRLREKIDKADVIISDMSPNISGNYTVDQAKSVYLAMKALKVVDAFLKPGGNFIVKIFEGEDFPEYIEDLHKKFEFVKVYSPPASRAQSSEVYVICKGYLIDIIV